MDIKVKKKLLWAVLLSIVFMVFLIMRIDWQQFSLITERTNIKGLTVACGIFMFSNLLRAARFNKLDHMGGKLTHWWNITGFYNIITATLPGGAGEAATVYVLKRFSKFNMLSAFRILLLSRVMDLFALSALFFVSALFIGNLISYRETALWFSGGLLLLSSAALLRSSEQLILKLMQKLPVRGNLVQRIKEKISELIKITEEQHNKNAVGLMVVHSVIMMGTGVVSIHLVLISFGIDFTPLQSAYCYGIYMIFQIVPIQGFAGIGTQAAWWALALNAAGYSGSDAIALGMVLHGTFYVFIVIIGLTALILWLVSRISN